MPITLHLYVRRHLDFEFLCAETARHNPVSDGESWTGAAALDLGALRRQLSILLDAHSVDLTQSSPRPARLRRRRRAHPPSCVDARALDERKRNPTVNGIDLLRFMSRARQTTRCPRSYPLDYHSSLSSISREIVTLLELCLGRVAGANVSRSPAAAARPPRAQPPPRLSFAWQLSTEVTLQDNL
ncbi:hypothetical protein EVAR_49138_1 [Eumeta japonica]|uniref:Uncharacterized protein n=1 Tax=Eumeta variegata TaxID=151549 RepID=A0A4C1Z9X6_EUMVA|nr:hypothetical protein EVAR_49138_1 [Eumeta japonica]